jgi:hypothetical protein
VKTDAEPTQPIMIRSPAPDALRQQRHDLLKIVDRYRVIYEVAIHNHSCPQLSVSHEADGASVASANPGILPRLTPRPSRLGRGGSPRSGGYSRPRAVATVRSEENLESAGSLPEYLRQGQSTGVGHIEAGKAAARTAPPPAAAGRAGAGVKVRTSAVAAMRARRGFGPAVRGVWPGRRRPEVGRIRWDSHRQPLHGVRASLARLMVW